MKTSIIISSVLFMLALSAEGQFFKPLRYDENYKYLKDSAKLNWYQEMKFSRISPSGGDYITFGGEIRYQFFKYRNESWGDAPVDKDGFLLSRLLLHADWHPHKVFRLFTQLQSSVAAGRIDPSPVELNELELHQVFADITLVDNQSTSLLLRSGRQEMSYGSSRLISPREGPNNRQAFDGFKVILKHSTVRTDLFYTRYVTSRTGIFNDKAFNKNMQVWGAYAAFTEVPFVKNLDVYYFGIQKAVSTWSDVKGKETRHSIGSRIAGAPGKFTYDVEGLLQFGDIADNSIFAWTLSSNTTYALGRKESSPVAGLKTELISGDRRQGDGKIQSFNPMFPRGAYFGYAALIGPSNLFDIHPSIAVPVTKRITAFADYDIFWRYSNHDGLYSPGNFVIYPAGESPAKFIGHQISGTLEFQPNPFVFFRIESTFFKTGRYLEAVGAGKDIFYIGFTSMLRF